MAGSLEAMHRAHQRCCGRTASTPIWRYTCRPIAVLSRPRFSSSPPHPGRGQEPAGIEAAAAVEKVLVETIARGEKSVVAIARVRKEQPGEALALGVSPRSFRPTVRCCPTPRSRPIRTSCPASTAPAWSSIAAD